MCVPRKDWYSDFSIFLFDWGTRRSDLSHPQPRTGNYTKVWKPSRCLLRPTSRPKWPAVVQSLMLCTLSASQNRLEIERWKKARALSRSLPFHSIEYAPEQTDIWVTLHSLKTAKWIPDPFLRPPPNARSQPVTHKLHVRMSDLFFIRQVRRLPTRGARTWRG